MQTDFSMLKEVSLNLSMGLNLIQEMHFQHLDFCQNMIIIFPLVFQTVIWDEPIYNIQLNNSLSFAGFAPTFFFFHFI